MTAEKETDRGKIKLNHSKPWSTKEPVAKPLQGNEGVCEAPPLIHSSTAELSDSRETATGAGPPVTSCCGTGPGVGISKNDQAQTVMLR